MNNSKRITENQKFQTKHDTLNSRQCKGQVSTELLVIISAALFIFIPLMVTGYLKANQSNEELFIAQTQLAVSRTSNMIESIGNLGEGASSVLEIYVPKGVKSIKFEKEGTGGEVVITMETSDGITEIAGISRFPPTSDYMIDDPPQGIMRFVIASRGKDGVSVTKQ
ncbi:MAG: hypothetical protein Q7S22_09015 [Candidatus Micrarchaeota archaeon]|nr:hypothetical protein [Candidatus Micrarchaeota archaeon]